MSSEKRDALSRLRHLDIEQWGILLRSKDSGVAWTAARPSLYEKDFVKANICELRRCAGTAFIGTSRPDRCSSAVVPRRTSSTVGRSHGRPRFFSAFARAYGMTKFYALGRIGDPRAKR